MKQFQFTFRYPETLTHELQGLSRQYPSLSRSTTLIQLYADSTRVGNLDEILFRIREVLPAALVVGCSAFGSIYQGAFSAEPFLAVCTLFERPSSQVELLLLPMGPENQQETAAKVVEEVEGRKWVKGIQMLASNRGMSITPFCQGLAALPQDIALFGGVANGTNISHGPSFIFTGGGGVVERGVALVLFGGPNLHITASHVTGWKPLGSYLTVTNAQGNLLKELNGRPAYETYGKYLHIRNDANFFDNSREFPFFYQQNGIDIMRAPRSSNPDGSLTMSFEVQEGTKVRLAYGDPRTILASVRQESLRLLDFDPQCFFIFSCAGRRTFWGTSKISRETADYQLLAPTSGFYTSGEFLRTNGHLNQHNLTQVVTAMREGEAAPRPREEYDQLADKEDGKVSIISRMATFIKVTTEELEEANKKLSELAITDALTGVGNKAAYFSRSGRLEEDLERGYARFSVAVFDLNGLKAINDHFGHQCGDIAIQNAADLLKEVYGTENVYRIGGDEFIAILDDPKEMELSMSAVDDAFARTNRVEKEYKMPLTISKGISSFQPGVDTSFREVLRRADDAMYKDKEDFYSRHEELRRR